MKKKSVRGKIMTTFPKIHKPLFALIVISLVASILVVNYLQSRNTRLTTDTKARGSGWLSGAGGTGVLEGDFATGRGTPLTIIGTWNDDQLEAQNDQWSYTQLEGFAGSVDNAIGGPLGGETYADVADGKVDSRLKNIFALINQYWGNKPYVFIRYAHEFNLTGSPWAVNKSNVDDFKRAWAHVHGLVQSELVAKGKNAKLVWSPNDDNVTDVSIDQMWPGDQYVDVIGVDSYNMDPERTTENWETTLIAKKDNGSPRGIESWRQFAKAHGKPLSFPEWGADPTKTLDSPFYIQKMNEFFRANAGTGPGQVWYEIYFNDYDCCTKLFPSSQIPQSAAMYKSLQWGDNTTNNPVTPLVTGSRDTTSPTPTSVPTSTPPPLTPTMYCAGSTYCVPSTSPTPVTGTPIPSTNGITTPPTSTPDDIIPDDGATPQITATPERGNNGYNSNNNRSGNQQSGNIFQQFMDFIRRLFEYLITLLSGNANR